MLVENVDAVDVLVLGLWPDVQEHVALRMLRTKVSTNSVASVLPICHQDASMAHQLTNAAPHARL